VPQQDARCAPACLPCGYELGEFSLVAPQGEKWGRNKLASCTRVYRFARNCDVDAFKMGRMRSDARSENIIDDLGGIFRLFLKQALYESVLVAFIGAVIPSDWSSLFDGSEHPG
jgi:hypothetical protein